MESRFGEELQQLKTRHLFRTLRTLAQPEAPYAVLDGRKLLLFCGNDYLGLSHHPKVRQAAQQAIEEWGVGSGASRLISGSTKAHDELEAALAQLKRKQTALLFSTGYQANIGILTALAGKEDLIVMDKLCHASIIDGARLSGATIRIFPHRNYARGREIFERNSAAPKKILISESLFSMDGDLADLSELVAIKKKYKALLMIDDSHATGILGPRGGGAVEQAGLGKDVDLIMGTLSKALGCLGGFVTCSDVLRSYLINHARSFIYSTSLPPSICRAAGAAIQLLTEEPELRERLWENIQFLDKAFQKRGLMEGSARSPILPVIVGEDSKAVALSKKLLGEGIWIPAIRPPTVPKGKARLRITVSADHRPEDLEKLLLVLDKVLRR